MILWQQIACPRCGCSWDVETGKTVTYGQVITCVAGCGTFAADENSVQCCIEDANGLLLTRLTREQQG